VEDAFGESSDAPAASTAMTVDVQRPQSGLAVVSASGEIDLSTVPALETALLEAQSAALATLIVDLDRVTFLDSSGISALVAAHKRANAAGTGLRIISSARAVRRPLELVGLDAVLKLFDSYDAALAEPQVG
jgi:stage II sporulation protein AA (anti-sigma F factor antagonist)